MDIKMNKISIVIPCFNEEEALPVYYEAVSYTHLYVYKRQTQIYTESPQATVDKHIREWNEMNLPRSIYIDEKDLEERNVPDFLKSH